MNTILQKRIDEAAKKICCTDCPMEIIRNCKGCVARENAIKTGIFALQNQWISVEEALPEFYRNVLVIFGNLHITNAYYDGEYWWWNDGFPTGVNSYGNAIYSSQQRCEDKPTHWMVIPSLKGGEK